MAFHFSTQQFDLYDGVHFDLADRTIVSRIQRGFHSYVHSDNVGGSSRYNPYLYGYYDPWLTQTTDWNDVLLFLEGKELYLQVNQNLMGRRIFVRPEPARFRVAVCESSEGIVLQPELERSGSVMPLPADVVILTNNPLWVLKDDEVFPIQRVRGDELAMFKRKKMRIIIPSDEREAFLTKMMPQLLTRYEVQSELQHMRSVHTDPIPRLYLLEEEGELVAELSGTPVENNLMELWSQFTFLNPGMLGSETAFAVHFAKPIERYKSEAVSASLKRIIFPFILRRIATWIRRSARHTITGASTTGARFNKVSTQWVLRVVRSKSLKG